MFFLSVRQSPLPVIAAGREQGCGGRLGSFLARMAPLTITGNNR